MILSYTYSNMISAAHSDAGYLNETNTRSRDGGQFFLSKNAENQINNSDILKTAQIITNVMTWTAEDELAREYVVDEVWACQYCVLVYLFTCDVV